MSMMHTLAPTPHTLQDRFFAALEQVQDKLLHLLANSPLLLVAILIVLGAIWLGGVISRRMHVLNRISRNNPYMDGLVRTIVRTAIILVGDCAHVRSAAVSTTARTSGPTGECATRATWRSRSPPAPPR